MTRDEAIAFGEKVVSLGLNDETQAFVEISIKSLNAWDEVDRELKTIMEGDKRTFSNRITEDGKYYDGIYKAIKVIDKHLTELKRR